MSSFGLLAVLLIDKPASEPHRRAHPLEFESDWVAPAGSLD
jgi:hypothetical protein